MAKKICIVLGTRPEIIKMSPVIRAFARRKAGFFIVHTGQHYSPELDRVFFRELKLPAPKYNLHAGSGTQAEQLGKMFKGLEAVFKKERPGIVLAEGDTNSVFAGAFVAKRLGIPVGHVEAGLRSYDERMPEETNRILTDHMSELLFAPTPETKRILIKEGISPSRIFVTGNTVVDAVRQNLKLAGARSRILTDLGLERGDYLLATFHRAENTDDRKNLKGIVDGLARAARNLSMPVVVPLHPRTRKCLAKFRIRIPRELVATRPVGYLDFLKLMENARLILTDSGGIQEEACVLKVPCVTLRENTERPETLAVGSNALGGTDPSRILRAARKMMRRARRWRIPFGDGRAGEKIAGILKRKP